MWNICGVKHDVLFVGIQVLNGQGKFRSVISPWFIINPSNSFNVVCELLHYLDCSLNFSTFCQSLDLYINKEIKSSSCEGDGCIKLFSKFAASKFLFWGGGRARKKLILMKQNAADGESVPTVWHFAVKKKSSSLSYFCRLEKLWESIVQKDKCNVCCQGYHGTASFSK